MTGTTATDDNASQAFSWVKRFSEGIRKGDHLSWADAYQAEHDSVPLAVMVDMLRQPANPADIDNKGAFGDFIPVHVIRNYLDDRIGNERYDWIVTQAGPVGPVPFYVVIGTLTLYGTDRSSSKSGGGSEPLWEHQPYQSGKDKKGNPQFQTMAYGGPFENAEASALRRAAMAFRFTRYLWTDKKGGGR